MKIIFLDIDGVLNGYNFWSLLGWKVARMLHITDWYRKHTRPIFSVHEEKVKRLAQIVHATNAKVVMSSSWRHGWWNTPYEKMHEDYKLLSNLFNKYDIEVIDITGKDPDGRRENEIYTWIDEHYSEIFSFVILDDEKFDLERFSDFRLVQTSSVRKGEIIKGQWFENLGIKRRHVKKAIEVLKVPFGYSEMNWYRGILKNWYKGVLDA